MRRCDNAKDINRVVDMWVKTNVKVYNETLRGCFTVGEMKKYQKNNDLW